MILYYLLIWPLSKLPLRVLYIISNGLFFLLYSLFGYRKKVVVKNLKKCFPDKTEQETITLSKRFYSHLADLFVESIKGFSITKEEILKRVEYINPQVINDLLSKGRTVIYTGGHYNNWEMAALATPLAIKGKVYAIYFPLKNKALNDKLKSSRETTGITFIGPKQVKDVFEKEKDPFAMVFLTDQSPSNAKKAYWTTFLGRETGVLFGAEKFAKQYNASVVYGEMRKKKRGFYELELELLAEYTTELAEGEVTELHTKAIEKTIRKDPAFWLWTHKRWKRKKPS